MTTAAQGVQKALARAGSSVIAIAEMSAADLLAQMSDEQKAALAASVTPAPAPAPVASAASEPTDEEKEAERKKKEGEAAPASDASSFAAVNARFQTVVASEHYAGNEQLAHALLGNNKLSAAEITGALAAVTKPGADASVEQLANAKAEGERSGMKAALSQTQNSDVEPGGAAPLNKRQAADAVWDRARAKVEARRKGA